MALRDAKRLAQSNASCLTEARMEVHEFQKSRSVDPVAEMMDFSAVRFVAANKGPEFTARELEEVNRMCISDGTCRLCGKGCYNDPSDGHLKSQGHLQKVKEEALCNRLFGRSQTFRRLDSHGCRSKSKCAMEGVLGSRGGDPWPLGKAPGLEGGEQDDLLQVGQVKQCKDLCH